MGHFINYDKLQNVAMTAVFFAVVSLALVVAWRRRNKK